MKIFDEGLNKGLSGIGTMPVKGKLTTIYERIISWPISKKSRRESLSVQSFHQRSEQD